MRSSSFLLSVLNFFMNLGLLSLTRMHAEEANSTSQPFGWARGDYRTPGKRIGAVHATVAALYATGALRGVLLALRLRSIN